MNEQNSAVVENVVSDNVQTNGASETTATSEAPKLTKAERRAQRKAQRQANSDKKSASKKTKTDKSTSKIRKRSFSTVKVKSKRHVIVTTDKKGAETYACGRIETSRTAKINAVLLEAKRPLTRAEIQEKLDTLYGAGAIKALSNHLYTMLQKGAVVLKDGAYSMKRAKSEKTETSDATGASE